MYGFSVNSTKIHRRINGVCYSGTLEPDGTEILEGRFQQKSVAEIHALVLRLAGGITRIHDKPVKANPYEPGQVDFMLSVAL